MHVNNGVDPDQSIINLAYLMMMMEMYLLILEIFGKTNCTIMFTDRGRSKQSGWSGFGQTTISEGKSK